MEDTMTTKKTGDAGTVEPLIALWEKRQRLVAPSSAAAGTALTAGDAHEIWSAELDDMAFEIEQQIVNAEPHTVAGWAIQANLLAEYVDDGIMEGGLDAILARRLAGGLGRMARL